MSTYDETTYYTDFADKMHWDEDCRGEACLALCALPGGLGQVEWLRKEVKG
jgi:hypothetical protein